MREIYTLCYHDTSKNKYRLAAMARAAGWGGLSLQALGGIGTRIALD